MQFVDLARQYQVLKADIDAAVSGVLERADFVSGSAVGELEKELAETVGVKHAKGVANGTDAMELVLLAWGVGPGDAVFVPTFTFMSTAEVVAYLGATPVFVDVLEDTFNIDPASLEEAIQAVKDSHPELTPKAIIPVDLFGLPANYDEIDRIAKAYELKVLEDGAQGFGGSFNGKRACSFGDAATTSFFPAKPLGCYGDGGAIFTNDDELHDLLRSLHIHGKGSEKYDNIRIGRNSRLDTIQAAVLRVKLAAFEKVELELRNKVAKYYSDNLEGVAELPVVGSGLYSSWAQYTLKLKNADEREALQKKLAEAGVPTAVYYPRALHQQTAFEDNSLSPVSLSVAEDLSQRVLSLPMHPYISEQELEFVVVSIKG